MPTISVTAALEDVNAASCRHACRHARKPIGRKRQRVRSVTLRLARSGRSLRTICRYPCARAGSTLPRRRIADLGARAGRRKSRRPSRPCRRTSPRGACSSCRYHREGGHDRPCGGLARHLDGAGSPKASSFLARAAVVRRGLRVLAELTRSPRLQKSYGAAKVRWRNSCKPPQTRSGSPPICAPTA